MLNGMQGRLHQGEPLLNWMQKCNQLDGFHSSKHYFAFTFLFFFSSSNRLICCVGLLFKTFVKIKLCFYCCKHNYYSSSHNGFVVSQINIWIILRVMLLIGDNGMNIYSALNSCEHYNMTITLNKCGISRIFRLWLGLEHCILGVAMQSRSRGITGYIIKWWNCIFLNIFNTWPQNAVSCACLI